MTFSKSEFWRRFRAIRELARSGQEDALSQAIRDGLEYARRATDSNAGHRHRLMEDLAQLYTSTPRASLLSAPDAGAAEARRSGPRSVSVVTSCRDRNDNLRRSLRSWLACEEVSEIVIVDWSSTQPVAEDLARHGLADSRIKTIRVEGESRWILTLPFNLGFQHATNDEILKADADIVIDPAFFRTNVLRPGEFMAGNWRRAAHGQAHVNGFFYAWRNALLSVNGFNEFITTYGWDDDDLYTRLAEAGFVRVDVRADTIYHLPHDDSQRISAESAAADSVPAWETLRATPKFLIRANYHLARLMPAWNPSLASAKYDVLDSRPGHTVVRRRPGSGETVPDPVRREAECAAARDLMAWRFDRRCYALGSTTIDEILSSRRWESLTLAELQPGLSAQSAANAHPPGDYRVSDSPREPAPAAEKPRAKIYVDCQHGLGNRLRAIGSAAAIAEETGRELVIVWQPDSHCECRFTDLFEYEGEVRDESFPDSAKQSGMRIFNYMEIEPGAKKDATISFRGKKDVYLRSAYVFKHPASSWQRENRFLRELRPVKQVRDLVESVRSPNDVAVHVRMVGGKNFEHLAYESSANWTGEGHQLVDHWRSKSHYSSFMRRIDALLEAGEAETLFVAADLPETYKAFEQRYGDRLAYLPRTVYDRSTQQLIYALADAILLSRAPRLLGSTWSSFSELAMRLAAEDPTVEMSGTDF